MDVKKFMAEEAKEHAHKSLKTPMSHAKKKVHKKAKAIRYKSVPKIKIEKTSSKASKKTGKVDKVAKVMKEFSEGKLHASSKKGPLVKNKAQALAIGYSEKRRQKSK